MGEWNMKLKLFRKNIEESEETTEKDLEILGKDERFFDSSIFVKSEKRNENQENKEPTK